MAVTGMHTTRTMFESVACPCATPSSRRVRKLISSSHISQVKLGIFKCHRIYCLFEPSVEFVGNYSRLFWDRDRHSATESIVKLATCSTEDNSTEVPLQCSCYGKKLMIRATFLIKRLRLLQRLNNFIMKLDPCQTTKRKRKLERITKNLNMIYITLLCHF